MGITSFEIYLLQRAIARKPDIQNVMELGSQNLYLPGIKGNPPFASMWYESENINYCCIDLAGDNGAFKEDLAYPLPEKYFNKFDLVTDFGTSEHVVRMDGYTTVPFHDGHINSIYPDKVSSIMEGYYNCWLNKHNMLRLGGIMISVNPLTGNWPMHGYSYLNGMFYGQLTDNSDYEVIELGSQAASGNKKDGYNVYCVMQKKSDAFPSLELFSTFDIQPA